MRKPFLLLYKALTRPDIEYTNQVWAPPYHHHRECTEKGNETESRIFKDLTYIERLKRPKLPILGYRRVRGEMISIELCKILKSKYNTNVSDFIL